MDTIACNNVQPVGRKVKKKQVKGELDRLKQAEKKKRRLEKALATSAAIISELEKKKQKKKEEQNRLDEEGAAIAEAVALHVLLGEDSDDPCNLVLNKEVGFGPWDSASSIDLFMGKERASCLLHQDRSRHEQIGWISNTCQAGYEWSEVDNNNWSFSYGSSGRDSHTPYFEYEGWEPADLSAGLIAAQAVSSLHIAEDACIDTIIFNGLGG